LFKLFDDIEAEKRGQVDAFFCGNPKFSEDVERSCIEHKFKFYKEIF